MLIWSQFNWWFNKKCCQIKIVLNDHFLTEAVGFFSDVSSDCSRDCSSDLPALSLEWSVVVLLASPCSTVLITFITNTKSKSHAIIKEITAQNKTAIVNPVTETSRLKRTAIAIIKAENGMKVKLAVKFTRNKHVQQFWYGAVQR